MGRPGHPLPLNGKSSWLIEDARHMEEKLAELRVRMQGEQRERQQRLEAGRVWASSEASRPLVSRHQIAGRGNITLESSLRQAAASRVTSVGSRAPPSNDQFKVRQVAQSCNRPVQRQHHSDERHTAPHRKVTVKHTSTPLMEGSFDEDDSRRSFLAALDDWRSKSKHTHHMQAVDVAVVTDRSSMTGVAHGSGASVFQRILRSRAMRQAGADAASECHCLIKTSPENLIMATPASLLSGAEPATMIGAHGPGVHAAGKLQHEDRPTTHPGVMDFAHTQELCSLLDENVVVLSVTDVDPHQALTSMIRFPDAVILPD